MGEAAVSHAGSIDIGGLAQPRHCRKNGEEDGGRHHFGLKVQYISVLCPSDTRPNQL